MQRLIICMILLTTILTSCRPTTIPEGPWVQKIDSAELSRLVINFSKKMKDDNHLDLEDSWAAYDDNIQKICLHYSSQRLLNLYQARLLMVEVVEEFLYRLNNHTILGFELERYPFTAYDLDVQINFESFYGFYCDPLYIGMVWLQGGCVHFYAFDRKDIQVDWSHQRFEPYFKSRELALLKKEADIPFVEVDDNPPEKPDSYRGNRDPKKVSDLSYDRSPPPIPFPYH